MSARSWRFGLAAGLAALALGLAAHGMARACGHCLEDKIAATYDAAVLKLAARRGLVVVFTEIRGPAAGAPPELAARIRRAIESAPGVEPGTVRVSLDPPAASFACRPGTREREAAVEAATRGLVTRRLSLVTLEVADGPLRRPRPVAVLETRPARAAR